MRVFRLCRHTDAGIECTNVKMLDGNYPNSPASVTFTDICHTVLGLSDDAYANLTYKGYVIVSGYYVCRNSHPIHFPVIKG